MNVIDNGAGARNATMNVGNGCMYVHLKFGLDGGGKLGVTVKK